jgi:hypothetical protein
MTIEIQTALIAALVALITASITGLISWLQLRREKDRWMTELKLSLITELHKSRLGEYPKLLNKLQQISFRSSPHLTPEKAQTLAQDINNWFYSTGGLIAEASTRSAILGLREACANWKSGDMPQELVKWRNIVVFLLRRDLDILGLESFDAQDTVPLLNLLQAQMNTSTKSKEKHSNSAMYKLWHLNCPHCGAILEFTPPLNESKPIKRILASKNNQNLQITNNLKTICPECKKNVYVQWNYS